MYGFIYITENLVNGKKYVGMCKNTHRDNYLGSGKLLKAAIKKYGRHNFERVIVEECETFDDLSQAEKAWISKLDAVNSDQYYNLYDGGFGGNSEGMRKFWSQYNATERRAARNWSMEKPEGYVSPMKGKTHSDETKRLIGSKSVNRNWGRKTPMNLANNPKAKSIQIEYGDGLQKRYGCIKELSIDKNWNYNATKKFVLQSKGNFIDTEYGRFKISYADV